MAEIAMLTSKKMVTDAETAAKIRSILTSETLTAVEKKELLSKMAL